MAAARWRLAGRVVLDVGAVVVVGLGDVVEVLVVSLDGSLVGAVVVDEVVVEVDGMVEVVEVVEVACVAFGLDGAGTS